MPYDDFQNCYNCSHLSWDGNCHCWECLIDGHELSTDSDGLDDLSEKSCSNFEE